MKFDNFSKNYREFKFHCNRTSIKGVLHEDQYTFFVISRSFLLRMRIISDKYFRENHNTHLVYGNFFSENRVFYKKKWKNIVDRGRPQMKIWHMSIS